MSAKITIGRLIPFTHFSQQGLLNGMKVKNMGLDAG